MKKTTKELTTIAIGASLMAVIGPLSIPISLVPISLQTFGVGLIATLFPPRMAVASVLIYLLLGGIGLPVFARGTAGFHVLTGATAGFLWGFIPYAYLTAKLVKSQSSVPHIALANLLGVLPVFIMGASYFAYFTKMGLSETLNLAVLPFIPGDFIKIMIISFVAPAIFRALKGIDWYKK